MHTIQVYIDESLGERELAELRKTLLAMPHVEHVAVHVDMPHDLLVEYEEHHVAPMDIVETLHQRGMHPDVISG